MYPRPTTSFVPADGAGLWPAGRQPTADIATTSAASAGAKRRISTNLPPSNSAAADERPLEQDDDDVQRDPDQGDRHEGREHQRDVEQARPGEVDQHAEATLRPGPLRDDRADDGERDP